MKFETDWQQLHHRVSRVARGGGRKRSPFRPASAQALVEFVLVSIPLFATMFGIFEFGLAFWNTQQLAQAVREAARETAACNNQCDTNPPTEATNVPDPSAVYKDMRTLQALVDKNPTQRNASKLKPQDIDYVLIRRVADTTSAGGGDNFIINTETGKIDISGQYQLYVPDVDANNNPVSSKYLPFKDADQTVISKIGLPNPPTTDGQAPNYGTNWFNTSYAASPCIGNASASQKYYADTQNSANAASGFNFTCLYDAANTNDPTKTWSRGRSICQPSDRFYVEVAYRHYWSAPFFPEVGVAVRKPTNDNGFIIIKQRVYLKIEPVFFPITGGVCPTGAN